MEVLKKRRTWKRAPIKKSPIIVSDNKEQKIEKICHNGKFVLAITYKNSISLNHLSFLKKATLFLKKHNLPFSTLLSFDHSKLGYRGIWSLCQGNIERNWKIKHYHLFGDFLGRMHQCTIDYLPTSMIKPPIYFSIKEQYEKLYEYLPSSFDIMPNIISEIEKNWPVFLPTGLIHTDLYQNNILFSHNKVSGILQNHNMQIDLLQYDIASVVKSIHFTSNSNIKEKEEAFFQAYSSHITLTPSDFQSIGVLTSAKLLNNCLEQIKKHFKNSSYTDTYLNCAAISLVHSEKALSLYKK